MNREELKEKICKISNSEFPLIDFFNDIGWLEGSKWFNTEKAYEDIEKIYNVFTFYINKCKKLEKELKQTKSNFKNSQTHSKNCYKKLKEKFERGKEVYHRNYELIQEIQKLKEDLMIHSVYHKDYLSKVLKYEKAIKIIKEKRVNPFEIPYSYSLNEYNIVARGSNFDELTQEQYNLLQEVFESVGDKNE